MHITYFVHSITDDNEKGLATGWLQGNLSEEGVKRAKAIGNNMDVSRFDAVFCSDLRRAIDSTDLFFKNKLPRFVDWRLRECNYGDLDGSPAKDFKKNREQEYIDLPYSNGESYRDVEARLRSFLTDLERWYSGKHVAVVAHQAPQLALGVLLKNITWEQAIEDDWRKTGEWRLGWTYDTSRS